MTVHLDEYEWIHHLAPEHWDGIVPSLVELRLVVPTQIMVNLACLLKVDIMIRNAIVPTEPALFVKYQGKYLIKDGHHRYATLVIREYTHMAGIVYVKE